MFQLSHMPIGGAYLEHLKNLRQLTGVFPQVYKVFHCHVLLHATLMWRVPHLPIASDILMATGSRSGFRLHSAIQVGSV